jgi:WD40 repeat protein/energy-coupling factor transporter ATP-binding protein EcfA2
MNNLPPRYHVFLSHNSADKPAVEELARRLVQLGLNPFLDIWHLIPGEPFQDAIEEALDQCATVAVFVGPSGRGPWQHEEMRVAIQRRVNARRAGLRPFRVIPVLLPGADRGERSKLPDFLVQATWVEFHSTLDDEQAFHRLVAGIRGRAPGPGLGQAAFEGECPYRGLLFFDVEHARFFFGREALTEWLVNALRKNNRFLAIVGPSGSGKSSLARAGLVAALKQGALDCSAGWSIAIFRPGNRPLENLAAALYEAMGATPTPSALRDLIESLRGDQRMLHLSVRLALRDIPPDARLLLLVDQFEEAFTLCPDQDERQALFDNLLYASRVADGQTIVIPVMRADFYPKCAAYPGLAAALSDHQVLVGPMTDEELLRAIERPAQLTGCELEAGLVERLMQDVRNQPGELPLLQDALLELWRCRNGRRLTHQAYEAIGGIEGALELRAESVYGELTPTEQQICRHIFLQLTQPGEGTEDTKRRVSFHELQPTPEAAELVEAVAQKLASERARLVTIEGEQQGRYVEVAHEALIRDWSRLRGWIDADREGLLVHRHLREAASEWERLQHDLSALYRGIRLAQAMEWAQAHPDDLDEQERTFLRASKTAEARGASLRYSAVVAIVALALAALFIYALSSQSLARGSRSAELVAQAEASITSDPELSIGLALEAISTAQTAPAVNALRGALQASYAEASLPFDEPIMDVAFSPNGKTIVAAPWDGRIQILNRDTHQVVGQLTGNYSSTLGLAYSSSGDQIASGDNDGTVRLWNADTYALLHTLSGHRQGVRRVDFSPDGRRLASASEDGTAVVWDTISGQSVETLTVTSPVHAVAFSNDGKLLATASQDGVARVWDLATTSVVFSKTHTSTAGPASLWSVSFSPTGDLLAVGGAETLTLWRPKGVQAYPVARLRGHTNTVISLHFSSDGKRMLSADTAGKMIIWNTADLTNVSELKRLQGHTKEIYDAVFDQDGTYVASASGDQTVRLWSAAAHHGTIYTLAFDPTNPHRLVSASADGTAKVWSYQAEHLTLLNTLAHGPEVLMAVFSPNGQQIATAGNDRVVKLWDAGTGRLLGTLERQSGAINSVAFSHDGTRLATASLDGRAGIWDARSGRAIHSLQVAGASVMDVAFSHDDRLLATANGDNLARLWRVDTGEVVQTFAGHYKSVNMLAFNPKDGSTLATASSDGAVMLWNSVSAKAIYTFTEHTAEATSLAYDTTGRHLATADKSGRIIIYDLATGQLEEELSPGQQLSSVTFSPDGKYVLFAGNNDDIAIQALTVPDLVAQAQRRFKH